MKPTDGETSTPRRPSSASPDLVRPREIATRIINAGLREIEKNVRCLPIEVGEVSKLRPMLDALKIRALVIANRLSDKLLPLADAFRDDAGTIDLVRKKRDDLWYGSSALTSSTIDALSAHYASGAGDNSESSLENRNVLILGAGGVAAGLARTCAALHGLVSIAAPNDTDAKSVAAELDCRFVPFHNIYNTLADVVIIADSTLQCGALKGELNPSVVKPGMLVVDSSDPPEEHPLFEEARSRGCTLIEPAQVFAGQIARQFYSITGVDLPPTAIASGLAE